MKPAVADPMPIARLACLYPSWFAVVMGLCGFSLAWRRVDGEVAAAVSAASGMAAALCFAALLLFSVLRVVRHPQAVREDWQHPVRHAFFAAVPISMILLATVAVAHGVDADVAHGLWVAGALLQLGVTVWVLSRWLRSADGKLAWPSFTPVLFIPVVGNVLAPLAGGALGHPDWAAAQFGIGLFLWPVVLTLLVVRIGVIGLWPARLLPTTFITVAPPSVVGLAMLQMQWPPLLAWMSWGVALYFLLWASTLVPRLRAQPFGLPFWGMSFPLAAFAALSLRLAAVSGTTVGSLAAVATLALATAVVAGLVALTLRGLVNGSLLVPEPAPPAAQIAPGQ